MLEIIYSLRTKEELETVREKVQKHINDIVGKSHSFFLNVAINEAINNALNAIDKDGSVTIMIRVTKGNRLIIRVKDSGEGFHAREQLGKIGSSLEQFFEDHLFEESGRGLALIQAATDKVIYNRKGNEMLLMKHLENSTNNLVRMCP